MSRFTFLLAIACLLLFVPTPSVSAETETLEVTKDTFANEAYPDNNYHFAGSVVVSNHPINRLGYLQFEWFDLPEGAEVDQALLRFYVHEQNYNSTAQIDVGPLKDEWTEDGVSWNNRPDVYPEHAQTQEINLDTGWKEVNVTGVYNQWQSGDISPHGLFIYPAGLLLSPSGPDFAFSLKTKEATENAVRLVIDYHFLPTPTPTETPTPTPTPTAVPAAPEGTSTPKPEEGVLQTPTPTPTASPTPSPEAKKGSLASNTGLWLGIGVVGGGLLAVLFFSSLTKKKKKPTVPPKTKETVQKEAPPANG